MPRWNKATIMRAIRKGKTAVAMEGAGIYSDLGMRRAEHSLLDNRLYSVTETPWELVIHVRDHIPDEDDQVSGR